MENCLPKCIGIVCKSVSTLKKLFNVYPNTQKKHIIKCSPWHTICQQPARHIAFEQFLLLSGCIEKHCKTSTESWYCLPFAIVCAKLHKYKYIHYRPIHVLHKDINSTTHTRYFIYVYKMVYVLIFQKYTRLESMFIWQADNNQLCIYGMIE